jgi:ferric enterobactin receptor
VKTDIYQWENVPKAVVEGLEGTLNVPVSETVNWTNNITYMLQSKNKETGDRLSIIPEYTLNSTLSWQIRRMFRAVDLHLVRQAAAEEI